MMKRSLEITEDLRELRQKIWSEKEKQRELYNPLVLLNNDTALWKAKLQSKANPVDGLFKLVIYGSQANQNSRVQYAPDVFNEDTKWDVEDWSMKNCSEKGAIVAYSDNPLDLLPPKLSMMRLALFSLPYMIVPKKVSTLPTHESRCSAEDEFQFSSFGFGYREFDFNESYLISPRNEGQCQRDLRRPEDVEYFFKKQMQRLHGTTQFKDAISKAEASLADAERKLSLYKEGEKFRADILNRI